MGSIGTVIDVFTGSREKANEPTFQGGTETSAQSIRSQIDALPKILEAQRDFSPQFTEFELEQLKKFGPQQLEQEVSLQEQFGPQLAAAQRESLEALSPERISGQNLLKEELDRPLSELVSPEEEQAFRSNTRAAQSSRGLAESGFGALDEVRGLTELRNILRQQRLNLALSAATGIPSSVQSSFASPSIGQNQLVQNVDPRTFFGGEASRSSSLASAFGQNQNALTQQRGQDLDFTSQQTGQIRSALAS